jgi:hypothetical protein
MATTRVNTTGQHDEYYRVRAKAACTGAAMEVVNGWHLLSYDRTLRPRYLPGYDEKDDEEEDAVYQGGKVNLD